MPKHSKEIESESEVLPEIDEDFSEDGEEEGKGIKRLVTLLLKDSIKSIKTREPQGILKPASDALDTTVSWFSKRLVGHSPSFIMTPDERNALKGQVEEDESNLRSQIEEYIAELKSLDFPTDRDNTIKIHGLLEQLEQQLEKEKGQIDTRAIQSTLAELREILSSQLIYRKNEEPQPISNLMPGEQLPPLIVDSQTPGSQPSLAPTATTRKRSLPQPPSWFTKKTQPEDSHPEPKNENTEQPIRPRT